MPIFLIILVALVATAFVVGFALLVRQIALPHHPPISAPDRGTWSERRLVDRLQDYGYKRTAIYHDLYVPRYGGYSQVDAVLCTDVGLIVIEVKDYIGWIFGNGKQDNWTQVSGYGSNKYRFYNPVKQNAGHIAALKQHPALKDVPMYSLIVFYGDCEFKDVSGIPNDVELIYGQGLRAALYDLEHNHSPYQYADKWAVANALKAMMDAGNDPILRQQQVENARAYKAKKGIDDSINYGKGYPTWYFRHRRRWY